MNKLRTPSPALVISLVALFVALGGTTYAATSLPKNSVGTRQLKKNAVTSKKIKNGAVTAAKIDAKGLVVPSAVHATNADHAASAGSAPPSGIAGGGLSGTYPNPGLAPAEAWHEIGAPGQPPFLHGWTNVDATTYVTAGFYKDPFGGVHLKGYITGGASGDPFFALPAGYTPSKWIVWGNGVIILPNGALYGVTGPIDLDGITFRAGE